MVRAVWVSVFVVGTSVVVVVGGGNEEAIIVESRTVVEVADVEVGTSVSVI